MTPLPNALWHLSRIMTELGWTKAHEPDFSRPGNATIVRGFVREDG
jgi:hypothetical protein